MLTPPFRCHNALEITHPLPLQNTRQSDVTNVNSAYLDSAAVDGKTPCHPRSVRHQHLAAAAIAGMLLCGCVGPWAHPISLPTPATHAVPTGAGVRAAAAPELGVQQDAGFSLDDEETSDADMLIRGQSPEESAQPPLADDEFRRDAMPVSGVTTTPAGFESDVQPAQFTTPAPGGYPTDTGGYPTPGIYPPSGPRVQLPPAQQYTSPSYSPYNSTGVPEPYATGQPELFAPGGALDQSADEFADLVVNLRETQTGRFMFGVGVNSDLGLTAQVIIDERNFDYRRFPTSLDDIINGTAWRGGGQALRIEAVPGSEVQRYLVNFTEPYLFDTPITLNLSGFLFDRRYFDYDEQRLGGRVGLGYRITPDLSISLAMRLENVGLRNPRVPGIPELEQALGDNDLYGTKVTITHDTRDIPFAPTEGHYLELSYEQVFGNFDYPRGNVDYRRYFLLRERADGSGRHTLGLSAKAGFTGSQTPVYENFFAGGYSTLRGFRFRHASPKVGDVIVGGELSLLGSVEYIFPITADDMLKGAVFTDFGTVEEGIGIDREDFRVAVGAGMRISVPALGPAPIAVDFAIPVAREATDRVQNFSFFVGFGR